MSLQKFATLPVGPFKWSGKTQPPELGASVHVTMNNLGPGTIKGYFIEEGWLGVLIELRNPPDWWKKQNAKEPQRQAYIFGTELRDA